MPRTSVACGLLVFASLTCAPAYSETSGRGEGGIVIEDNVAIFKSSDGDRKIATCVRGDVVGGLASILGRDHVFTVKNGRVQIEFFPNVEQVGLPWSGWIDPKHLSVFSYDCSCSAEKGCTGTRTRGLAGKFSMSSEWNTCFREARDAHIAQLKAANWELPASGGVRTQTKTVELGQTIEEVEAVLGKPEKALKAGAKVIYIYPDLKITFEDSKVVDFQ